MKRALFALGARRYRDALSCLPGAFGRSAGRRPASPRRSSRIGGTFPFSGPASSYAPIPVGMEAYFSYMNATKGPDGKRGVCGRQIVLKYYDDGYNPAQTVQQTKQLVEQDKVFALVGGLGTEPQQAVTAYLNQQKVPQIYVSTGATYWGADRQRVPVDDRLAARLPGRGGDLRPVHRRRTCRTRRSGSSTRTTTTARTTSTASRPGSARTRARSSSQQGYEVTDTSLRVAGRSRCARPGVDTLMIFATPTPTIRTYATMAKAIGWKPADDLPQLGLGDRHVHGHRRRSRAGAAEVNGSISTTT